jgi:Predicted signal transduction protein with a C-terminal ATPase domain
MWLISDTVGYVYFSSDKQNQISQNQIQTCNAIQGDINDQIGFIDSISLNIQSSQDVIQKFTTFFNLFNNTPVQERRNNANLSLYSKECSNIVNQIVGINHRNFQVDLYDLRGDMIGSGMYNGYISCYVSDIPFFVTTLQLKGKRNISGLHHMGWIPSLAEKSTPKISVSHSFKGSTGNTVGIVEVAQNCGVIFYNIKNFKNINVYVFNSEDACIYPYNSSSLLTDEAKYYYYQIILQNLQPLKINSIPDFSNSKNQVLMTYSKNPTTGFTTVVTQPRQIIYNSLFSFNLFFIALAGVELILTLLLSFALAGKITRPLYILQRTIKWLDFDQMSKFDTNSLNLSCSGLEEIDDLSGSFTHMYENLKKSLNDLIISKSEEANSKILAVQAQMNPHFLYNNIANIIVMAENGMDEEIIFACRDISFMLRYIAKDSRNGVSIKTEMEYTKRYFNCIKIRYSDNIKLNIKIPEAMEEIVIPKLSIQPLVENAVKYGLSTAAPWELSIIGRLSNEKWTITVTDSGLGMDPAILQSIMNKTEIFNQTENIPEYQIHGMGLLNIYIRLKLLYKDNAIFEIGNNKPNGCSITIGGTAYKS